MYRCESRCPGHDSAAETCDAMRAACRRHDETLARQESTDGKIDRVIALLEALLQAHPCPNADCRLRGGHAGYCSTTENSAGEKALEDGKHTVAVCTRCRVVWGRRAASGPCDCGGVLSNLP